MLSKIRFKKNGKIAYLCDTCETFWYADEHISVLSGKLMTDNKGEMEVTEEFEDIEEKDQDHKTEGEEVITYGKKYRSRYSSK